MRIRQNVAVVYSPLSRAEYIRQAKEADSTYTLRCPSGYLHWLKGEYAYLSANGISSFLRRLGVKFDIIEDDSISFEELNDYDFLFVCNACKLDKTFKIILGDWISADKGLFVSGLTDIPLDILGISEYKVCRPDNYSGIAWNNKRRDNAAENIILSPPGYHVPYVKAVSENMVIGAFIEYDTRQGAVKKIDEGADALIKNNRVFYLPFPVFEFTAGLMQGHQDIEPLRDLLSGESNFYIDKTYVFIKDILKEVGFFNLCRAIIKPWGDYDNVFILRHDTDLSSDEAYYDYEIEHKIPATYAILPDRNRKKWLSRLARFYFLECAYHFRTNKEQLFFRIFKKLRLVKDGADKKAVEGVNLLGQLLRAEKDFNINFKTLHRHYSYFYYPEIVLAIKLLYDKCLHVLGMGTMFRFSNLRYSGCGDSYAYTVRHPDVSVSFWFPFKMAVATVEYFEILRGWDSASFIEPDFAMTDAVFENAIFFPAGVYTFGFHPAHTRGGKFNAAGNYEWFIYSLNKAVENRWWIANCEMVYAKLNDWEDLVFRYKHGLVSLYNPSERNLEDIFIETDDIGFNKIKGVASGRVKAHGEGVWEVPFLRPKEKLEFMIEA